MGLYESLQLTASQLIEKFGVLVTWKRREVSAEYEPGLESLPTETTYSIRAVVRTPSSFGDKVDPPMIHGKQRSLILAAKDCEDAGLTPQAGDIVTIGSYTYSVTSCGLTEPGGTGLIWQVEVSR